MYLQGTSTKSEAELLNEAEGSGIRLSATSSREVTGIYAQCLSKDVPKGTLTFHDNLIFASLVTDDLKFNGLSF
jgi:predicted Zn-dependent peptidase